MKHGDLVMLKSGGPVMTIGPRPSDSVLVPTYWFDGDKLQNANFSEAELTTDVPKPGSVQWIEREHASLFDAVFGRRRW